MFNNVLKLIIAIFLVSPIGFAQARAYVNSYEITDTLLIDNELYLSAREFAKAIAAQFSYDAERGVLAINYDGHILVAKNNSLEIDNKRVEGNLVDNNAIAYLPLKSLATAFNASSYFDSDNAYLLLARAKLLESKIISFADYDRVILEFENLSPYSYKYDAGLNTLEISFNNVVERPFEVSYGQRLVMELGSSLGYLNLKLILGENSIYSIYNEATNNGFKLIVDVYDSQSPIENHNKVQLILDDNKIGESQYFVDKLVTLLSQNNIQIETLSLNQEADKLDYLSDAFIKLNISSLDRNQVNLYYQSGKTSNLVRDNASRALERTNDPEKLKLLRKLANNYRFGQGLAQAISDAIFEQLGYQSQAYGEDLATIANLAGRGVVLELSQDSLNNELLIDTIARAIAAYLEQND